MPYCTKQDLIDRFGEAELIQLTDRANLGVINDTVLDQAISDAGAEIDGYLSKYSLPLATVPTVLVRGCCDIARYYLYDDMVPDLIAKRYDAVIRFLAQVAKGTIGIGPDTDGAVPEANNSAVMESGGRIFGRSDKGFI
ncbi:MAG: DUF1320 family protein [Methylobacter sp.]|uniref:gp436 family protein n=1 Tax=Methylobacter sp. TaxID=2051955 RepID=UPI002585D252|nr:phage protein Gp36 family protein [Methylobacter sp.]MCL7422522.1 DUF1320 family protein [Methylobacter sp.]